MSSILHTSLRSVFLLTVLKPDSSEVAKMCLSLNTTLDMQMMVVIVDLVQTNHCGRTLRHNEELVCLQCVEKLKTNKASFRIVQRVIRPPVYVKMSATVRKSQRSPLLRRVNLGSLVARSTQ